MYFDFDPGDFVINPKNKDWGIGQVQSIVKNIVTINFNHAGKKTINLKNIQIIKYSDENK
jgi:hypothetical protein